MFIAVLNHHRPACTVRQDELLGPRRPSQE
jgi:hypothetical protein